MFLLYILLIIPIICLILVFKTIERESVMKWKKEIISGRVHNSLVVVDSEPEFEYVIEFHYNNSAYGINSHYKHIKPFPLKKSGSAQHHGRWN